MGIGHSFALPNWDYTHLVNKNNAEDIVELTPDFIKAIEKYDQLGLFSEGLAAAYKGEKWGNINTKGEEVIPTTIEAQCVGRFSEGLAFVLTYDGFNVIDKEGKIVFKGTRYYYGYADMKGNDTFSAELNERCHESKKNSLRKAEQVSEDDDYVISKDRIILDDENDNYNNSTASNSNNINNELAEYDRTIEATVPIMEKAYQQFLRDVRSGGYTTITPPSSFYELSNACTNVGAAAKQAQRLCERNGNMGNAQKYERIWEHERQLYNSAYNILGNLH